MGSMSTGSGSNIISSFTEGLILAGAAITILAAGKMVQCVVDRVRNPPAANPGAGEPPLIQVQIPNEIAPSASLGSTGGTATNAVPAVATPTNSEARIQVVIQAPPAGSTGHSTDSPNVMTDLFTTAYRMVADNVFSTFAPGTSS